MSTDTKERQHAIERLKNKGPMRVQQIDHGMFTWHTRTKNEGDLHYIKSQHENSSDDISIGDDVLIKADEEGETLIDAIFIGYFAIDADLTYDESTQSLGAEPVLDRVFFSKENGKVYPSIHCQWFKQKV